MTEKQEGGHKPNICIRRVRLGPRNKVVAKQDARGELAGAVLGEPDGARVVGQVALVLVLRHEVAPVLVGAVLKMSVPKPHDNKEAQPFFFGRAHGD